MLIKKITVGDLSSNYDNPIAELVQKACHYSSTIMLAKDDHRVNAKSIMGIMAFNPTAGVEFDLEVDGADEAEAIEELAKFISCEK